MLSILALIYLAIVPAQGRAESPSIESLRASYGLPALAGYAVRDATAVQYVSGVRKLGDKTQATLDDQWHLGSCTKAMTATVVATFVEEGALAWTTTLHELFPEMTSMHADYRDVTLQTLLGQRAGVGEIPSFAGGALWDSLWDEHLDPKIGRHNVAYAMLSAAPAKKPGSTFAYSNANYIIAGAALERLTGQSWETLIQKRLFEPLGMTSCGFGAAGSTTPVHPDQPWGHSLDNNVITPIAPDFYADNPPTVGPAGGVHCAMKDWATFLRLHLNGFRGEQTTLLHPATFAVLHTPLSGQDYTPGGWMRVDRDWTGGPALTHAGSNTYSYADVWLAPKLNTFAFVVSNYAGVAAHTAADDAIGVLFDAVQPH